MFRSAHKPLALASVVLLILAAAICLAGTSQPAAASYATVNHQEPAVPAAYCWSIVPSPQPGTTNYLAGVAAISANDVWAVGYYYSGTLHSTLVEHWNGMSWSVVSSPNPGTFENDLLAVTAISESDVWAAGTYGNGIGNYHTMVEHWDGVSWSVVPSPSPGTGLNILYSVTAVSQGDVWAVGEDDSSTLVEHWNGVIWSVVPSSSPGTYNNELTAVTAISGGDVWAVGSTSNGYNQAINTLIEHWNGTNWSIIPSPNPGTQANILSATTAISGSSVWAVGGYSNDPYAVNTLAEHWDGSSWSAVLSPNPGSSNSLNGIAAISGSDVWAVGTAASNSYITLAEHWDGSSWSVVPSPGSGDLTDVSAISGGDVWAVSDSGLVEHYSASVCSTPTPPALTDTPLPSSTSTQTVTGTPPTDTPTPTATPTYTPIPTPTPQPTVCPNPFVDITGDVFFYAINYLYCHGAIDGVDATHYNPTGTATRAEFAKVIVVALGVPLTTPASGQTFTDVPPSYFAYVYIESAYAAGVVSGYNDNTCTQHGVGIPCYLPDQPISRGQLTKLVVNAAHYPLVTPTSGQSFTDVPPANVFYVSIETAFANQVVHGYSADLCAAAGQAYPCYLSDRNIRRDEMSQIVYTAQLTAPTPTATVTGTPPTATPTFTPTPTSTPGGPTITPTDCPNPFVDITGNPYYNAIHYLNCMGAVDGTDATHFSPTLPASRAVASKAIALGFGIPSYTPSCCQDFTDVPPNYFAYVYIESGYHAGVLDGEDPATCQAHGVGYPCYLPNDNISRAEIAKYTVLAAHYQLYTPTAGQDFTDVPPSDPFYVYIETAYNRSVMNGYPDHTFRPDNPIQRDEMCQVVYNGITLP